MRHKEPNFVLKVCLCKFQLQGCLVAILLVGTPQSDCALMLGSNRKGDMLLSHLNSLLASFRVQKLDSEVNILNALCLGEHARGREKHHVS